MSNSPIKKIINREIPGRVNYFYKEKPIAIISNLESYVNPKYDISDMIKTIKEESGVEIIDIFPFGIWWIKDCPEIISKPKFIVWCKDKLTKNRETWYKETLVELFVGYRINNKTPIYSFYNPLEYICKINDNMIIFRKTFDKPSDDLLINDEIKAISSFQKILSNFLLINESV
nr:TPA_asm: 22 kDa protein [Viola ophiovirus]